MEVTINGQKLVRSPFSFLIKVRELNIMGKLDFPGEMPPSSAGIAVKIKVVIAVADLDGQCILVFDDTGKFVRLGCPGSMDGQFDEPVDVTFLNDDEILVVDESEYENSRIQVFTMDGEPVFKFGDSGPEGWIIRSFAFFTWTNSL
ncbi:E3 ubiquitin-protein ligase TRIM71-like [Pocillopora verrucosa]|uniref:E3 ubiquitin-protein ligase TRIM71-like n=1 Tax=Pocillopora verrucosa TaxID=203993 RepID=UPI0033426E95